MRAFLLTTFTALLLAGIASAQTPAAPAKEEARPLPPPASAETKKLNGFWKCESIVFDGAEQMADPAQRSALLLVVKDSEYILFVVTNPAKDEGMRLVTAHIALDAATKTFSNTIVDGREKGKKVHGIYELADGKFKTCYGPADQPRPTKFAAGQGSGLFFETWKVEPGKPAAAQPAGGK